MSRCVTASIFELTFYCKVYYSCKVRRATYTLLALAALAGCSRSNNLLLGRVEATVGTHNVVVTDCYRIGVDGPHKIGETAKGQPVYRYMPCRDADVLIRGDELSVNGASYGHIKARDAILVDHGVVSVTKEPR